MKHQPTQLAEATSETSTSKDSLEDIATQFGVDKGALASLLGFLRSNIERNADLRTLAKSNPEAFMAQGVKAWHEASQKFLSELAVGTSEVTIEMRRELASQVWTEIRTKAGLPT